MSHIICLGFDAFLRTVLVNYGVYRVTFHLITKHRPSLTWVNNYFRSGSFMSFFTSVCLMKYCSLIIHESLAQKLNNDERIMKLIFSLLNLITWYYYKCIGACPCMCVCAYTHTYRENEDCSTLELTKLSLFFLYIESVFIKTSLYRFPTHL